MLTLFKTFDDIVWHLGARRVLMLLCTLRRSPLSHILSGSRRHHGLWRHVWLVLIQILLSAMRSVNMIHSIMFCFKLNYVLELPLILLERYLQYNTISDIENFNQCPKHIHQRSNLNYENMERSCILHNLTKCFIFYIRKITTSSLWNVNIVWATLCALANLLWVWAFEYFPSLGRVW